MVVDGRTGRMVPPRDAGALGRAIVDVLSDPDAAAAMGRAGRDHVLAELGPGALIDQVADIYTRLIGDAR